MNDAFVTIHGHFYQPPRQNPWLEEIEPEESAHPFHDWNERIAHQCYRPNAHARIVDGEGKILDIINNYSYISFNFGPTLLRWFEKKFPLAYHRVLEADVESEKRWGHGNAIAQVYDHIIMPLADERDKETEILWGITDFKRRFGRKPEAMWLPETAVNYPTLKALAKHGMKFLILSPFQASKTRPLGATKWTDVSQGRVDSTQPYRCFVKDASGKRSSKQFLDVFFYDGPISREVSFGDLLKDGNLFCDRLLKDLQPSIERPQLIHIATDGETYGHHKQFGDMALAYALKDGLRSRGLELINYGAFLERFPPVYEAEIDEGPKGEGTSWSCIHGVGRWKEDCGCSTGSQPGWNQKWRRPLREALNGLKDELRDVFEKEGEKIFRDPWEARNNYIDVILNRSPQSLLSFLERFGRSGLSEVDKIKGLRLLEMQRYALSMFMSCGWFFADLGGLETIHLLQNASRAIQLAEASSGKKVEDAFLEVLSHGRSNLPEMGDGREIYVQSAKPGWKTSEKVVNHFAISSMIEGDKREKRIFSYQVERVLEERLKKNEHAVVFGKVKVMSDVIPEDKEYVFGLIRSKRDVFRTWIMEYREDLPFDHLIRAGEEGLDEGEEALTDRLKALFGNRVYTMRDTFADERQSLLQKLIREEVDEHRRTYADLYRKTKPLIEILTPLGLKVPYEICVAAEVTLTDRLFDEMKRLKEASYAAPRWDEIDQTIEEAERFGYHLKKENPASILTEILNQKVAKLYGILAKGHVGAKNRYLELVEELVGLIDRAHKWGLELRKGEAQNVTHEMLNACLGDLERCWWGWGSTVEQPFHPKLILLAEKLGFNVDRFSKMKPTQDRDVG